VVKKMPPFPSEASVLKMNVHGVSRGWNGAADIWGRIFFLHKMPHQLICKNFL